MRRQLVALLPASADAGLPTAAGAAARPNDRPVAETAKSCSSGYTHGVIHHGHEYLRAGEFCEHRWDRQYRQDGYRCTGYYAGVDRYGSRTHARAEQEEEVGVHPWHDEFI
jgi:hypothetical protein